MENQQYSPLRYPGGKASLYNFLKSILASNKIVDGIYAEAFAGGAGAALNLLFFEDVYEIYLNDKDELIYKFWKCILNETDDLIRLITDTKIDMEEWTYRKNILNNYALQSQLSDVELAFTIFVLNRTNRSGILKAGVIGGISQDGPWKLDARFNKQNLVKRIEKISFYKERIHLSCKDAISFLKSMDTVNTSANNLLIYLDPPFVNQGKALYRYYFKKDDHILLSQHLQRKLKSTWVLSYDDDNLIHTIYKEVEKNVFEFNYYANQTKLGKELIITSKNCKLPEMFFHYSKPKNIISENNIEIRKAI
jgi:DNA adenine methylase